MRTLKHLLESRGVCFYYDMPSGECISGLTVSDVIYTLYKEVIDELCANIDLAAKDAREAEEAYTDSVEELNAEKDKEIELRTDLSQKLSDFSQAVILPTAFIGTGIGSVVITAQASLTNAADIVKQAVLDYNKQVTETIPDAEANAEKSKVIMENAQQAELDAVNNAINTILTILV